jgi:hypothetical protein
LLVTYPVSKSRVPHTKALAGATQKKMNVGVFKVCLNDVVVNVLDVHLSFHPVQAHCLKLQLHECAGGVLRVCLWSMRIRISSPGFMSPCNKYDWINFFVTFIPHDLSSNFDMITGIAQSLCSNPIFSAAN